jgi:uncharacterized membrane protein
MRKFAAITLFLVAAFMLLGFSLSEQERSIGVTVFTLLLTVGLPVAVAIGLLKGAPRDNSERMQQLRNQTIDAEILRLAIERQGRLTAVEIMSTLGLPEADVSPSLDRMMQREIADMDVSEEGVLVYTFHDAKHLKGTFDAKHVEGGTEARRLRDG